MQIRPKVPAGGLCLHVVFEHSICGSYCGFALPTVVRVMQACKKVLLVLEIVISFLPVNVTARLHHTFSFVNMFLQFLLLKSVS